MEKKLVIIVDGSRNLAPYWDNIKTLLESIVRKFCAKDDSTYPDPFGGKYFLNLVVYGVSESPVGQCISAPSMDSFLNSWSHLTFTNDNLTKFDVTEGLSKALMMFSSTRRCTQAQLLGKRHCVLVTTSNPSPLPKEVFIPRNKILESGEVEEVQIESVLANAETVACSFAKWFVSLSVICPSEMQTLKTIYNAGSQVTKSVSMELKHSQLLLLISEQFPEAREALKQYEARSSYDTNSEDDSFLCDFAFLADDMEALQSLPDPDEELWQQMPFLDNIDEFLISDIKQSQLEMKSVDDDGNKTNPSQCIQAGKNESQGTVLIVREEKEGFSTLISKKLWAFEVVSSNFAESSTNTTPNEHNSMVHILHSQHSGSFGKSNESINLNGTNADCRYHPYRKSTISKPENTVPHLTSSLVQTSQDGILKASTNSKVFKTVNISQCPRGDTGNPLPVNCVQRRVDLVPSLHNTTSDKNVLSNGPKITGIGPSGTKCVSSTSVQKTNFNVSGFITCGTPDVLSNKEVITRINSSGTKDVLSTTTALATMNNSVTRDVLPSSSSYLEKPQFFGAAPLPSRDGVFNNTVSSFDHNMSINFSSEVPSGHIKAWEGIIASRGAGIALFMSKVVAYRKPTVPEKIFENWPKIMNLNNLVSQIYHRDSSNHEGKHHLTFNVLEPCPTWDRMTSLDLCAYIDLPAQTLVLSSSKNKTHLTGMLYEEVLPLYKNQIFKPYW